MGGEYCTCPDQPCPICRDTNICGCGYEVGSKGFQNFHVYDEDDDPKPNNISYQEWCEECNPTYEQLAKHEQLQRRDY